MVVSHGGIFYYNTSYKRFVQIKNLKVPVEDMDKRAFVTDDGVLWIFTQQTGELLQVSQDAFDCDTLSIHSTVSSTDFHAKPIEDVFYQNGVLCFIDSEHDLYVYDISRQSKIYIRNLSSLVQKNGTIAGIALFYEDIIIGFRTNGLVRLRTSQNIKKKWSTGMYVYIVFIEILIRMSYGLLRTDKERLCMLRNILLPPI